MPTSRPENLTSCAVLRHRTPAGGRLAGQLSFQPVFGVRSHVELRGAAAPERSSRDCARHGRGGQLILYAGLQWIRDVVRAAAPLEAPVSGKRSSISL